MRGRILNLFISIVIIIGIYGCGEQTNSNGIDEKPSIEIPEGDVEVAAYYFPNWGPVYKSDWKKLREAEPRFEGHQQPKVPLWGYENENKSEVMAKKIKAADNHGIDTFIFDWYYYDPSTIKLEQSEGKYLYKALEEGFLQAENNKDLKFSLMWANHDVGNMDGAIQPDTFENLMDYVIENYFKKTNYWKIDGAPYFSIYEIKTFLEIFDGDLNEAAKAIELFRKKVKSAGFNDLHLNAVLYAFDGEINTKISKLDINSTTSYVWIHHNSLPNFPASDYSKAADTYFSSLNFGGASNGLEKPIQNLSVPYHINVTMGWDSSPRVGNVSDEEWWQRREYPFGPVMVDNSPYQFKKALARAKDMTMEYPESERIITINSWNEWTEGSYLEPDTKNEMEYLKAVKAVFKD